MTTLVLKAKPQYVVKGRRKKTDDEKLLDRALGLGTHAGNQLVRDLRALKPKERADLTRALVRNLLPLITKNVSKGYPEYNPGQSRDQSGKWTVGGVASAAARMTGQAAAVSGKVVFNATRNALSAVTLVPSSKGTASKSLSDWWGRFTSNNQETHADALGEAASRIFNTIFIGATLYALAYHYMPAAADKVGHAMGQALKVLIGRR